MPLPVTDVERELRHTRKIRYEGYKRTDGLWDIEAHLTDVKSHDNPMKAGVRRAGQPIHEMWLRPTIDRHFNVLDACASSSTRAAFATKATSAPTGSGTSRRTSPTSRATTTR